MSACYCCGQLASDRDPRVDGGRMHLDCWMEHHSDPSGPWPDGHTCAGGVTDA